MLFIAIPDQYPNYYIRNLYGIIQHSGYYDTFFLSQQYRNNERLLYMYVKQALLFDKILSPNRTQKCCNINMDSVN